MDRQGNQYTTSSSNPVLYIFDDRPGPGSIYKWVNTADVSAHLLQNFYVLHDSSVATPFTHFGVPPLGPGNQLWPTPTA